MFLDSTRFLNFLSQSKFYVEQRFQPLSPKTKIAIRVSYFKRFTLYIPCLKPGFHPSHPHDAPRNACHVATLHSSARKRDKRENERSIAGFENNQRSSSSTLIKTVTDARNGRFQRLRNRWGSVFPSLVRDTVGAAFLLADTWRPWQATERQRTVIRKWDEWRSTGNNNGADRRQKGPRKNPAKRFPFSLPCL